MISRLLSLTTVAIASVLSLAAPGHAADALDTILARKQIVIGMEVANPPFETYEGQKVIGLDADVADELSRKLGVEIKFVDSAWDGILPALIAGKFDVILSGMIVTQERAAKVDFAMPYYEMGRSFLIRADETRIKSPMDLSGLNVGGQVASPAMKDLSTLNDLLEKTGKPKLAAIKTYNQVNDGYIDLRYKRIDAYLQSREGVAEVIKAQPGVYRAIDGSFDPNSAPQYLGIAVRKDSPKLLKALNDALASLKADGKLAEIQKKWIGVEVPTPNDYAKLK